MSDFRTAAPGIFRADHAPHQGALRELLRAAGARVLVGHPTFRNGDNIGRQLAGTIAGAARSLGGRPAVVVVVDGTLTEVSADASCLDAAEEGARRAMVELTAEERERVSVVLTPYEGYGDDRTPGKGSALKLLFEEGADTAVETFVLLDGDLRNDMASWLAVFTKVEEFHRRNLPECDFFVTARYARHFVDASLTRFVVGPLTTLLGTWVPGGISGDIVLSAGAARHELGPWSEARRKYGTDISTTFDNVADPNTAVYEVWLGAKLHDITDEGKLSVMPGEVIGAALESLLRHKERLTAVLHGDAPLEDPVRLGPGWTGIEFIDPGRTGVFDVDVKLRVLDERWEAFADDVRAVVSPADLRVLEAALARLRRLRAEGEGELRFLDMDRDRWIRCLASAVGRTLATGDVAVPKRALNYLYTGAFLEFCRERLADLGLTTLGRVRAAQGALGVAAKDAEAFYAERVDGEAERLAREFHAGRSLVLEAAARFR